MTWMQRRCDAHDPSVRRVQDECTFCIKDKTKNSMNCLVKPWESWHDCNCSMSPGCFWATVLLQQPRLPHEFQNTAEASRPPSSQQVQANQIQGDELETMEQVPIPATPSSSWCEAHVPECSPSYVMRERRWTDMWGQRGGTTRCCSCITLRYRGTGGVEVQVHSQVCVIAGCSTCTQTRCKGLGMFNSTFKQTTCSVEIPLTSGFLTRSSGMGSLLSPLLQFEC